MEKKRIISRVIILTATIFVLSINVQILDAETTTRLSIEPQIIEGTFAVGDTFTVNCSVFDVVELRHWQFVLFFDPTVLRCIDVWLPPDHVYAGMDFTLPDEPFIDNKIGCMGYFGAADGYWHFDGSGTLCQIEFEVVSCGESVLGFSEPYGQDTLLLDDWLDVIPCEVINGYFDDPVGLPVVSNAGRARWHRKGECVFSHW